MSARVGAANRTLLALIGLILLAAGVLGLARAAGAFGRQRASERVLTTAVRSFPDRHAWFWWAVAGAAVIIALLAIKWLMTQLGTDRANRIDRTTNARDGYTVVHAGALAEAVEDDARSIPGVTSAAAYVSHPLHVNLRVDLADDADIDTVRSTLESSTVRHVREALNQDDVPVRIELRPGPTAARSVA
jgi:hypothetical protein